MTYARLRLTAFAAGALFLGGCLPGDMPAYVNDGRTIVAVAVDPCG